jgi:hypothetical protein
MRPHYSEATSVFKQAPGLDPCVKAGIHGSESHADLVPYDLNTLPQSLM